MNNYGNPDVLLFLIAVVGLVPIAISVTNLIPLRLYPLAIFSVSSALVLHSALISQHLTGWDIQAEYYYYDLVVSTGHWTPTVAPVWSSSAAYQGAMSVTIFPAMTSLLTGVSGTLVFKVIFPMLYSMVPAVLFLTYRQMMGQKASFMAAFIFATVPWFSTQDLGLGKQMIAVSLLSVFLLALVSRIDRKYSLLLLLGLGVILAHYSTGLYFVVILAFLVPLSRIFGRRSLVSTRLVLTFSMFYLVWWAAVSSGFIVGYFTNSLIQLLSGLPNFFSLNSRYGVNIILNSGLTLSDQVVKILNVSFQALITLEVIALLYRRFRGTSIRPTWEFLALALVNFGLLVVSVVVPYFSSEFNISRLYSISLLFLAPFGVLGVKALLEPIKGFKVGLRSDTFWLRLVGIFALVFLLFNVGFVAAATNEPTQLAFAFTSSPSWPVYSQFEFSGGFWLVSHATSNTFVYSDMNSVPLFWSLGNIGQLDIPWPPRNSTSITQPDDIVFLGPYNLKTGTIMLATTFAGGINDIETAFNLTQQLGTVITSSDLVYNNGLSESFIYP